MGIGAQLTATDVVHGVSDLLGSAVKHDGPSDRTQILFGAVPTRQR